MLPGTIAAAAFAVALVPGYIFLLLTRRVREAQDAGPLESLIELITVGVATTGLSLMVALIGWSESLAGLLKRIQAGPVEGNELQDVAITVGLVFGASVVLALASGVAILRTRPETYFQSAWKEVFAPRRNEHVWLRLEMKDGRAITGPLHISDFTVNSGDSPRDIVLRDPIFEFQPCGQPVELAGVHRLVIPEEQVRAIKVVYEPEQQGGVQEDAKHDVGQ